MPSSRHVRMTRTAISPRLAMSTFSGNSAMAGRILRFMPGETPTWELDGERLRDTRFGTVRFYDELGSTNTELVEDARAGAPEGLVIVADHQTEGRGRLGRTWSAAPG